MSSIQQFNFNDKELRTHIKNGEIWYVAKDVYACLWIKWWWNRSLSAIKPEWRGVGQITTTWWIKDTAIINEKAVYKIAFRSKKETANKFTDFMAEVAEELRKTWSYTMVKPRSNAHALLEQMKVLVKHEEEIQELQDADSKLNQRQDELEAKIKTIDESHYTMAWWCSLKKKPKSSSELLAMWRRASKISRDMWFEIKKAHSPVHWQVNSYHEDVLQFIPII